MLKEISTYVRIVDLLLAILLILDKGVKSILVIAIIIYFISALVQLLMTYKRLKNNKSLSLI